MLRIIPFRLEGHDTPECDWLDWCIKREKKKRRRDYEVKKDNDYYYYNYSLLSISSFTVAENKIETKKVNYHKSKIEWRFFWRILRRSKVDWIYRPTLY